MLTRRQFLLGLGAAAVSTILSLTLGGPKGLTQDEKNKQKPFSPDCDWVIDNITIIDGTGGPSFRGKVAVKGTVIAAAGDFLTPAGIRTYDGRGLVLAPGFIDIHTHTENYVYSGESMAAFLSQGVTTQVGGNCGTSPLDIGGYFKTIPRLAINYGLLAGYAALREAAMGRGNAGKTNPAQLKLMQEHLSRELQAGALGLSVGLEYSPQHFATTQELAALCEVVKEYGGFYATHIRSEYNNVLPALEEAIEIGIRAKVPVQYSHIKAGYKDNWPKFPKVLGMLQEAASSGLDITADVYPYTFSSMDIGTNPLRHSISEENLEAALAHPLVFIGSDSGIYRGGRANHPRAYGNYPRVLGLMVREKKVIPLEKAIAKMTHEPARRMKLKSRGLIEPGFKADLVLFDPLQIADRATPDNPAVLSQGIREVWINGGHVWSDGEVLDDTRGEMITYNT